MIGKLAVSAANFAIDKPYSYRIPEGMKVVPGQRVQVPFGRSNKRTEGVVLTVEDGSEEKLKSIELCLDAEPIITPYQLKMAAFLRERYFSTFYDAIRGILPAGLWFQTKQTYALSEDRSWKEKTIKKAGALTVLRLLEDCGGQAGEALLKEAVADEDVLQDALSYLVKKKWVVTQVNFSRRMQDKTE